MIRSGVARSGPPPEGMRWIRPTSSCRMPSPPAPIRPRRRSRTPRRCDPTTRRGWPGSARSSLNWRRTPTSAGRRSRALAAVDGEVRVQIIAALAEYRERPGVRSLLDLLGSVRDPAMRTAARHALAEHAAPAIVDEENPPADDPDHDPGRRPDAAVTGADLAVVPGAAAGRIVRSLVTAARRRGERDRRGLGQGRCPSPDRGVPVRRPARDPRRGRRGRNGTPAGRPPGR